MTVKEVKFMSNSKCSGCFDCSIFALVVSIIIGVISAILVGTGTIVVESYFLYGAVITALVYLAALVLAGSIGTGLCNCGSSSVTYVLVGILGTILLAGILLAAVIPVGLFGSLLSGVLVFFISLMLSSVACLVSCFCKS